MVHVTQSYSMNITTVNGFETFTKSLTCQNTHSSKHFIGVDLVLSCVDNYEARMVVNQVGDTSIIWRLFPIF